MFESPTWKHCNPGGHCLLLIELNLVELNIHTHRPSQASPTRSSTTKIRGLLGHSEAMAMAECSQLLRFGLVEVVWWFKKNPWVGSTQKGRMKHGWMMCLEKPWVGYTKSTPNSNICKTMDYVFLLLPFFLNLEWILCSQPCLPKNWTNFEESCEFNMMFGATKTPPGPEKMGIDHQPESPQSSDVFFCCRKGVFSLIQNNEHQ